MKREGERRVLNHERGHPRGVRRTERGRSGGAGGEDVARGSDGVDERGRGGRRDRGGRGAARLSVPLAGDGGFAFFDVPSEAPGGDEEDAGEQASESASEDELLAAFSGCS